MPKNKPATIFLTLLTGAGVVVMLMLAFVLNTSEPQELGSAYRIKASSTTYTKTVSIKIKDDESNVPVVEEGQGFISNVLTPTPTQSDFNVVITSVPSISPTPTVVEAIVPTLTQTTPPQSLPASGIYGVSMGVLVLGFLTIFVAFLF